ncbi:ribosomal-protein-alanine N-acetyltransferase [Atopobacter sp. AH10]|nr:ribosomal-protein-alanine N-acetyltransferase [Atopobacter sp. AH10]
MCAMSSKDPFAGVREMWKKWKEAFMSPIDEGFTSDSYPAWSKKWQEGENSCQIRRIQRSDIGYLVTVEESAYEGQGQWGLSGFSFDLSRANTCYYVLFVNQSLVGYIGIRLDASQAHITQIAVHPKYQGQGFGGKLTEVAIDHAQFYQANHMVLEVRTSNTKAQALYHSYGFRVVKRLPQYYQKPKEDGYFMLCPLVERAFRFEEVKLRSSDEEDICKELALVLEESFDIHQVPYHKEDIEEHLSKEISFDYRLTYFRQTVAFIGYQLVEGQADLLFLAVLPDFRRQGLAEYLLKTSLACLKKEGAEEVFLEVRTSNLSAQMLYQKNGFKEIYQRKQYYSFPKEDALVMKKDLTREEDVK